MRKRVQLLRLLVQAAFLAAMAFIGFNTKLAADALLPAILLFGVFFCGWMCPLGAVQDWMARLGRGLKLPRLRVPYRVQRWLQLSRYAFFMLLSAGVVIVYRRAGFEKQAVDK